LYVFYSDFLKSTIIFNHFLGVNRSEERLNDIVIGYKCNFNNDCNYINCSKVRIGEHIKLLHTNQLQLNCNECEAKFVCKRYLKKHKKRFHAIETPFKCDFLECQYKTKTADTLKVHQKNKSFACQWPGSEKRYYVNRELNNHIDYTRKNLRPFVCEWPSCEAWFASKGIYHN
jgi:hypothetical protein